jgi:hypothetical protein
MCQILSFKKILFILVFISISISIRYFLQISEPLPSAISTDKRLNFTLFTEFSKKSKKEYYDQCHALFKKLRYPNPAMIFDVPPGVPPGHLKEAFEDFGTMKITSNWYLSEKYADSVNRGSEKKEMPVVTSSEIEDIQRKALSKQPYGQYGDTRVHEYLVKYNQYVQNKSGLVIGTQRPWIEAVIMLSEASNVTTLDYTYKKYESKNMHWFHVNDFLDESIKTRKFEQFDFSASYSSIEHSGLGRYGDPLSPYGDLEALQQIHCMLKPGGVLILGLPCTNDILLSYIAFNAHRIYGKKRLELLFGKDWELFEYKPSQAGDTNTRHFVFVIKKI